eukprot:TRINITY_DN1141_c0_g1_i1.p1 TRINITY_DN1141_c0_g1~~TRINITY_DN1141_c0_g1_i1.p1  ORF type:complete len:169 (-),score=78.98 TRINITY_DN1141_c0_g1_i1:94-600(-)
MTTNTAATTTTPSSTTTPASTSAAAQASRDKIKIASGTPVFFYVDLTTRFLKDQETVELSALGNAIATVVSISEILKNQGIATIKKVHTTTMEISERKVTKAKIEITVAKTPDFFKIIEQRDAAKAAAAAQKKAEAPAQPTAASSTTAAPTTTNNAPATTAAPATVSV